MVTYVIDDELYRKLRDAAEERKMTVSDLASALILRTLARLEIEEQMAAAK
jgi:predicted CopG family antitoxin